MSGDEITEHSRPWQGAGATGVGSLPGSDIVEAVKLVLGEVGLPYLPELPERGPGADLIGRGAGLLPGLPVELYAGQWRVASRPGIDLRRTRGFMDRDLDALTEQADGYQGALKLQACGPWTLAAGVALAGGPRMLSDAGAVRDLGACLADGLAEHLTRVRRLVPGARLVLQLDEPSLPAVLAGAIPTESGLHRLRAIEPSVVEEQLRRIVAAAGIPVVVHCCAASPPLALLARSGVAGVSIDLDKFGSAAASLDELAEVLDGGLSLFAGVSMVEGVSMPGGASVVGGASMASGTASSGGSPGPDAALLADRVLKLWRRLGFDAALAAQRLLVTPACGLAGATPTFARSVITACARAGRRIAEPA